MNMPGGSRSSGAEHTVQKAEKNIYQIFNSPNIQAFYIPDKINTTNKLLKRCKKKRGKKQ